MEHTMKAVESSWPDVDALFEHYLVKQNEYVAQYNGKVLVIHDYNVAGAFEQFSDAYDFAVKHFERGTFIIQKCSPGECDYTIRIFSPVLM